MRALLALSSAVLLGAACRQQPAPYQPAGEPPAVVQEMVAPESPYYLIYHPAVWLGRPGTEPRN